MESASMSADMEFLSHPDGERIALLRRDGDGPGFLFLPGFRSDMSGTKAQEIDRLAAREGLAATRFDYRGHGGSDGRFAALGIGDWLADTLLVLDRATEGPQILIGSSMGGWLALLAALRRPDRVSGLILVAPAPDFTERLMWARFPESVRRAILETGQYDMPSDYGDEPSPITRHLIEDGRRHLLLDGPIAIDCPVRILHGRRDPDVPPALSLLLMRRLTGEDVTLTFVKEGDHRLSRPGDLALLCEMARTLSRTPKKV